jgi:hypothetical protein
MLHPNLRPIVQEYSTIQRNEGMPKTENIISLGIKMLLSPNFDLTCKMNNFGIDKQYQCDKITIKIEQWL